MSKPTGIGDSLTGVILAVVLAVLLFNGDPCIAESLRVAVQKWAAK